MKNLALALLLSLSPAAFASNIPTGKAVCVFTEPFMSVTVDFDGKTMTVESIGEFIDTDVISDRTDVIKNITFVDGGADKIEVMYKSEFSTKEPISLFRLDTTEKGSDGMSDKEYDVTGYVSVTGFTYMGGCNLVK